MTLHSRSKINNSGIFQSVACCLVPVLKFLCYKLQAETLIVYLEMAFVFLFLALYTICKDKDSDETVQSAALTGCLARDQFLFCSVRVLCFMMYKQQTKIQPVRTKICLPPRNYLVENSKKQRTV